MVPGEYEGLSGEFAAAFEVLEGRVIGQCRRAIGINPLSSPAPTRSSNERRANDWFLNEARFVFASDVGHLDDSPRHG